MRWCLPFFLLIVSIAQPSLTADFSSLDDFLSQVKDVTYECSVPSNGRMKFHADHIEILDVKGKTTSKVQNLTYVEPGLARIDYKSGSSAWIAFSDDLETFAFTNVETFLPFTGVPAGSTFSPAGQGENTITLDGHDTVGKAIIKDNTIEVFGTDGRKIADRPAFRFLPHAIGFVDENQKTGFVLLSRENAGGWWMEPGNYLGSGVRTDKGGLFQLNRRSPLNGLLQRTVQFPKIHLRAGKEDIATAQQEYAISLLEKFFGENALKKMEGYKELGMIRASHLDREGAVPLYRRPYEMATEHLDANPDEQLKYIRIYGDALADVGDFENAITILEEGVPLLEKVDNKTEHYLLREALGKAHFGNRDYQTAINHFEEKEKIGEEMNYLGVVAMANIEIATCHRASGNLEAATAALDRAIAAQEKRKQENPKANYDTHRLALACVAFERWDDALRFAPLTNRKNSITYQEYAHLLALWNKGDTEAATALAKKFNARFGDNMDDEVIVRRDMDTMTIRLTEAIANPSPETATAFATEWDSQKESLKNRPLENYLFALAIVKAKEWME
ncbi:MAG: hypothetical protein CMO55_14475 [Verrucomicrobiales bacterium]|nr:hypothetical protein [Verrucomicrobiales bacterium]